MKRNVIIEYLHIVSNRFLLPIGIFSKNLNSNRITHFFYYLILLIVLCAPLFIRMDYASVLQQNFNSEKVQSYELLYRETFINNSPIDVLFIGPSMIWTGLRPEILKNKFENKLHRTANILTIGFNWEGDDRIYLQLRELLKKRKIHNVVTTIMPPVCRRYAPHCRTYEFFLFLQNLDFMKKIPWEQKILFYAQAVIGAPKQLYSMWKKPYIDVNKSVTNCKYCGNELGGYIYQRSSFEKIDHLIEGKYSYIIKDPKDAKHKLKLLPELNGWEKSFHDKIIELSHEYNFNLIYVYFPFSEDRTKEYPEMRSDIIRFLEHPNVYLIAIPPMLLFEKTNNVIFNKLFEDHSHFSLLGSEFFTKFLAKDIMNIYMGKVDGK